MRAVEIRVERNAEFLSCLKERLADRQRTDRIRYAQWPAISVVLIGITFVVFGPLEIRQHIPIRPAACTAIAIPGVIVGGSAARIDLRIDRRTAADDLRLC